MSETAAKISISNLQTVEDTILLAHADHLIDDKKYLLLFDLNQSNSLDLSYHSYAKFDLD